MEEKYIQIAILCDKSWAKSKNTYSDNKFCLGGTKEAMSVFETEWRLDRDVILDRAQLEQRP